MEFNDLVFVLLFLPIFVITYYIFGRCKYLITIFSILFYLLTDIKYFYLLIAVISLTYLAGRFVKNNKLIYFLYVLVFVLLICGFKYINLFTDLLTSLSLVSVAMPIGISYYLFESFAYVSDCYYGKYEAEKNFFKLATYVAFFPTIVSGPIIRYDDFKQYFDSKQGDIGDIGKGLRRFFVGFAKKIIIANQLFTLCTTLYSEDTVLSTPLAWLALLAYTLRLYYDFSACSDMAIGIGQMIGYQMPENFNEPYTSLSVSEFFRRWHITLGNWFKDYLYIPLGGNRKGIIRQIINLLIVWLCTGIWHGSNINFIIWGLFLGMLIVLEKLFILKIKLPKNIRWLYTTFAIVIGWLLFSTNNLESFERIATCLFNGTALDFEYFLSFGVAYTLIIFVIALFFMLPFVKKFCKFIEQKITPIYDLSVLALFIIALWLIVVSTQATSIYFGF